MSDSNADVWASLNKGDLIQFDGPASTKKPHKVMDDEPAGNFRAVQGPGGASKMLIQSKKNDDVISIMSMGNRSDSGSLAKDLRVVGSDA